MLRVCLLDSIGLPYWQSGTKCGVALLANSMATVVVPIFLTFLQLGRLSPYLLLTALSLEERLTMHRPPLRRNKFLASLSPTCNGYTAVVNSGMVHHHFSEPSSDAL